MMQTINVSIRMDKDLKESFDKFCKSAGMSMTTAVCIFAKKVVAEQKIPFEITANDPIYQLKNVAEIKRISKEMDEGNYYEINYKEGINENQNL